jgi:diacylglycerol kinase family enzyme
LAGLLSKDEYLYLRSISTSFIPTLALVAASFVNRQAGGVFCKGKKITLRCNSEQALQCDGEFMGQGKEFRFEVLPGSVKLIM